jgi:hypothetical protein
LGWFIELYRGEKLIEHGGNHWGVNSAVGFLPDRNLGVSVFVNEESDLAAFLMLGIFDRFIGVGGRDWVQLAADMKKENEVRHGKDAERAKARLRQVSAPGLPLTDYAGSYSHPGFGTIIVRHERKSLIATFGDDVSALVHIGSNVFVPTAEKFGNLWAMLANVQVQFQSGYDGRIVSLSTTATADGVVFKRD